VKRIMGNHEYLSFKDKMSLLKLFILGFKDYKLHPKELDRSSILEYGTTRFYYSKHSYHYFYRTIKHNSN